MGGSMKIPTLNAERVALLAEGEALVKAHDRLRLTPANRPEHRAYRTRLDLHQIACAPTSAHCDERPPTKYRAIRRAINCAGPVLRPTAASRPVLQASEPSTPEPSWPATVRA